MGNDAAKVDLTIYLAKDASQEGGLYIKNPQSLKQHVIDVGGSRRATLFIRSPRSHVPKWARFFRDEVDTSDFGRNASTGAVLAVPLKGKTFLLTFGQGWHCVDVAQIEQDFGLKTALNLIDPSSIRSIDKSLLEAQPKQLREQAGRATEIQNFGIDVERDLLRAVTGKPKEEKVFGTRVSGLDSLRLCLEVVPRDLPGLLANVLKAYENEAYKAGPFAWIDHIGQVRDPAAMEDLNTELIGRLNNRMLDNIWLSVPEIVDWNRIAGFRYSAGRHAARLYDIRVPDFLDTFGRHVTHDDLTRRKIYAVDEDDMPVFERTAFSYLYAELPRGNNVFLLNNGSWYRVESHYAQSINKAFGDIPSYDKNFPDYDDDNEGAYNARVAGADPDEYVLLDKALVHVLEAASPIEVCDLYRAHREFVHVKRYGGSSVLSHLFNQGLVSGEMFQMDPGFRASVSAKLPADKKIADPAQRPSQHEYRVVYAIISESDKPLSIPFFSKVSLKHCASRLQAMGYDVFLAKISVAHERKVLKVIPAA